ncbi:hypothetical protein EDB87DRAFT_1825051 [Lactarius vividus]|nr:hypothetical protein EDB87DRAFT_1825051 [Lactarius vividus]
MVGSPDSGEPILESCRDKIHPLLLEKWGGVEKRLNRKELLSEGGGRTFRSSALDGKLGGSCGITVATKTSAGLDNTVGDNGKDMRNAGGEEEEENVLKQRRQDRRGDNYTGVALKHHESGAYSHRVNNEAKVKRGQKFINQWLKHTTPGRIKPQAQSDNPSETRNHTVHEADPITIQAQAHLDPSGRLPARVPFVMQDISGVDTFTSGGCNPFCAILLGGAARVCTGGARGRAKRNS